MHAPHSSFTSLDNTALGVSGNNLNSSSSGGASQVENALRLAVEDTPALHQQILCTAHHTRFANLILSAISIFIHIFYLSHRPSLSLPVSVSLPSLLQANYPPGVGVGGAIGGIAGGPGFVTLHYVANPYYKGR